MAVNYTLTLGGVVLPTPARDGVSISKEKIWSSNTGRSNFTGKMLGTIIAVKTTIEITFPPLTPTQVALIDGIISDKSRPFPTLEITDADGVTKSMSVYSGTPTYPIKGYVNGVLTTIGCKVDLIER